MKRWDVFCALPHAESESVTTVIGVRRVSRDGAWADIVVSDGRTMWSKRQLLLDGTFTFPHRPMTDEEHIRMAFGGVGDCAFYAAYGRCGGCGIDCGCGGCQGRYCAKCPERIATGEAVAP